MRAATQFTHKLLALVRSVISPLCIAIWLLANRCMHEGCDDATAVLSYESCMHASTTGTERYRSPLHQLNSQINFDASTVCMLHLQQKPGGSSGINAVCSMHLCAWHPRLLLSHISKAQYTTSPLSSHDLTLHYYNCYVCTCSNSTARFRIRSAFSTRQEGTSRQGAHQLKPNTESAKYILYICSESQNITACVQRFAMQPCGISPLESKVVTTATHFAQKQYKALQQNDITRSR